MRGLGIWDYTAMVVYLFIMVLIGLWFSRNEKTSEDYLLGGRSMPWWAIGISMLISLLSTISLVAAPGEVFNHGITLGAIGMAFSIVFGIPAFFMFTRFYFQTQTFTPYEYLEKRFDHRIRLICGLTWCLVRLMYIGLVLYSSAMVFKGASQWPVWVTILVVGSIGTAYTYMGGMKAVVWTDLVQFVALAGGLTWIIFKCIDTIPGGASGIVTYAFEHGRGFEPLDSENFFSLSPYVRLTFWGLMLAAFFDTLFTYSADQLAIQRMLSTSSYRMARRSFFTFWLIVIPMQVILLFIGMAIFTFYGINNQLDQVDGDIALFQFIATQLPSPAPGIILSAMLAAVMSTLDSTMNSLATVTVKDVYLRHINPKADEKQQVKLSKTITLTVGVFAVGCALAIASVSSGLGQTFIEAGAIWMALIAVVPPIFLVGVTTTRVGARHVWHGIIIGWCVTAAFVIWYLLTKGSDHAPSFMWTSVLGSAVMTLWCYLPVICHRPILAASQIEGLTLWTLKQNNTSNHNLD